MWRSRVNRFIYRIFPWTWNKWLRFRIVLSGGRGAYITKLTSLDRNKERRVDIKNTARSFTCIFSVHNDNWCDLPCYECVKHTERRG